MHSLDVASANQGTPLLEPSEVEGGGWKRGSLIDLRALWHISARLFLIRATCFIHYPCTLLLSEHIGHFVNYLTMVRARVAANVGGFGLGGEAVKDDCWLELFPLAGIL